MAVYAFDVFEIAGRKFVRTKQVRGKAPADGCFFETATKKNIGCHVALIITLHDHAAISFVVAVGET